MLAYEVSINGETACVAGIEEYGVLTAILSWVRRRPDTTELSLDVSGLVTEADEAEGTLRWLKRELTLGDSISIRLVEVETVDEPLKSQRMTAKQIEASERAYYKQMKRKFEEQ